MDVGEDRTQRFPQTLGGVYGPNMGTDMPKLDARPKHGIEYENWGKSDFVHPFNMGYSGIHFNASKFQQYIFENCTNEPDVSLIDSHISHDQSDSDVIIDCTGAPKTFEDYELVAPGPITTKISILVDEIINFRNNQFKDYFQELF